MADIVQFPGAAVTSHAEFAAACASEGIRLPVTLCAEHGTIVDADGDEIAVADPAGDLPNLQAAAIALLIAQAINRAAGLPDPAIPAEVPFRG